MAGEIKLRKYDWGAVKEAYEAGESYEQISKEFGVTEGHVQYILKRSGITPEHAAMRRNKGYRKLVRAGKSYTRILSIPAQTLRDLGVHLEGKLLGKWIIEAGRLLLEIKEE